MKTWDEQKGVKIGKRTNIKQAKRAGERAERTAMDGWWVMVGVRMGCVMEKRKRLGLGALCFQKKK